MPPGGWAGVQEGAWGWGSRAKNDFQSLQGKEGCLGRESVPGCERQKLLEMGSSRVLGIQGLSVKARVTLSRALKIRLRRAMGSHGRCLSWGGTQAGLSVAKTHPDWSPGHRPRGSYLLPGPWPLSSSMGPSGSGLKLS